MEAGYGVVAPNDEDGKEGGRKELSRTPGPASLCARAARG